MFLNDFIKIRISIVLIDFMYIFWNLNHEYKIWKYTKYIRFYTQNATEIIVIGQQVRHKSINITNYHCISCERIYDIGTSLSLCY